MSNEIFLNANFFYLYRRQFVRMSQIKCCQQLLVNREKYSDSVVSDMRDVEDRQTVRHTGIRTRTYEEKDKTKETERRGKRI